MNVEAEILFLKRELRLLKQEKLKQTWVKVGVITDLTGWNFKSMAKAREQGLVKFRKDKNDCFEYLLQSIDQVFIKK